MHSPAGDVFRDADCGGDREDRADALWKHAGDIGEQKGYTVEFDELARHHKGCEQVEEAIEALMTSILKIRLPDGWTRRMLFLGGDDFDDPERPAEVLSFGFDWRLVEIFRHFAILWKISLPTLMTFSSPSRILHAGVSDLKVGRRTLIPGDE